MASPQLENGYTRIANELLEAICRLKISGNEMRILLFIIRQTYGYSRKSAKISLSEISKAVGMTSDNVSKTLKKLSAKNVVKICKNGGSKPQTISVNKDYEQWGEVVNPDYRQNAQSSNLTIVKNDNPSIVNSDNPTVVKNDNTTIVKNDNPYLYKRKYKENIKERGKESTPARKIYGNFGKVRLSEEEYARLVAEFGETNVREYIRRVDEYAHFNGKNYPDGDSTIRKWLFDGKVKRADIEFDWDEYRAFMKGI